MKNSIIITVLVFLAVNLSAQTDTTFYYKDNKILVKEENGELKVQVINDKIDSAETILFEGNYGDDSSSEVTFNFTFSKFVKNKKKKHLYAHGQGFGFGSVALSTRNFKIDNNEGAVLSHAWEASWNFFAVNVPFSPKNNWLFATSFGWKANNYYSDNNTAFQIVDGKTVQVPAPENIYYSRSVLGTMHITITPMIEWQSRQEFFVQAGAEIGIKVYSRSYAYYRENDKKKNEEIDKRLNVNPFDVSLKVGLGYGPIGIYAKYGLTRLFKQGKGADVVPVSFGIIFDLFTY